MRILVFILAALAAVGLVFGMGEDSPADKDFRPGATISLDTSATTIPTNECQEDDPCWNCEIHGNRTCGPVTIVTWEESGRSWVQINDERDRVVFGPVLVANQ